MVDDLSGKTLLLLLLSPSTSYSPISHRSENVDINNKAQTNADSLSQQDSNESEENWAKPTSTAKALQAVSGWDPYITELIKATPENTVLDWKLMWRNPQPQWTSPLGRVVQIGDAAHPFLPTSASGGTMAMEDAFSLAACLQAAGKEDVCLAAKVHNHLRYVTLDTQPASHCFSFSRKNPQNR